MNDARVRRLVLAAVLVVAAVAAVVSYRHIVDLVSSHGWDSWDAHLLPLSVDGTVAAASGEMVAASRGRTVNWIARVMLGLGVAATLTANVAAEWPRGIISAIAAGWVAVAFIGCVEMALRRIRKQARAAAGRSPAPEAAKPTRHRAAKSTPADRSPAAIKAAIETIDPPVTGAKVGELLGASERTGRRYLQSVSGQETGT